MIRRARVLLLLAFLSALTPLARGGEAEDKLGAAYVEASPVEKMVLLSTARSENVLPYPATSQAVEETVRTAIGTGETPEARLRALGRLRAEAQDRIKELNVQRRQENKRAVSFAEPDNDTQLALSLDYVQSVAGDQPTLAELACLKLVREATSWAATTQLVLGFVQEALNRDAEYRGADLAGRLRIIRKLCQDDQMMSDHERTVLEKALLSERMSAALQAGATPEELLAEVADLKSKQMLCFFSASWADGMLKRLKEHRAGRTR